MSKRGWFIGLVALALAGLAEVASGRLALVIGNDQYTGEAVLHNAVNDAVAMRKLLRQAGFELMGNDNTSRQTLADLITDFGRKLRVNGGPGVFYYSGHGMQVGGKNYLIPVDAEIRDEHDLQSRAVLVESVLNQMDGRGPGTVNLVILDACRVNPFPWIKGGVRGLAQEPTPDSTLILYAAKPGTAASDNVQGSNGLFTHHLVQALSQPGAKVRDALDQVATAVYRESEQKQTPWLEGLLLTPFVLIPAEPTPPPPVTTGGIDEDDAMTCEVLKTSVKPATFKAYLGRFPKGRCAGFAEVRLAELESPPARSELPAQVEPPPSPPVVERKSGDALPRGRLKDGREGPALVFIKGGCFQMGSPASETGREPWEPNEKQHRVCVKDFALAQYEVTVGEFKRFVEAVNYRTDAEKNAGDRKGCYAWSAQDDNWEWRAGLNWRKPGYPQQDNFPVACVSWNDAQAYVKWLSGETGQIYLLPTEAEWEYAARAGMMMARYWGDDPNKACRYANVADQTTGPEGNTWTGGHECNDSYWYPAPVGTFLPNDWKLYDMLGNVWEWTCSAYDKEYGGAEQKCTKKDTIAPLAVRGGGWVNTPDWVRSAVRLRDDPTDRDFTQGFRLARSL